MKGNFEVNQCLIGSTNFRIEREKVKKNKKTVIEITIKTKDISKGKSFRRYNPDKDHGGAYFEAY